MKPSVVPFPGGGGGLLGWEFLEQRRGFEGHVLITIRESIPSRRRRAGEGRVVTIRDSPIWLLPSSRA
jgi:hypothetical protein